MYCKMTKLYNAYTGVVDPYLGNIFRVPAALCGDPSEAAVDSLA